MGKCVSLAAGIMVGAAAVTMVGAMNAGSKRKLKRFCIASGRKLAEKTENLFG